MVIDLLVWALIVGMSAAAIPPCVRTRDYVQDWMLRGIKPWACDLCMSFWSTVFATLFWWWFMHAPLLAGAPAFVVTFMLVRYNSEPKGLPPVPDLEDQHGS